MFLNRVSGKDSRRVFVLRTMDWRMWIRESLFHRCLLHQRTNAFRQRRVGVRRAQRV